MLRTQRSSGVGIGVTVYHKGAVLRLRDIAFRLLPVLVVLWATVAILGGAVYLTNHAAPPDGDTAAKAGLGLCAVSAAIFAGKPYTGWRLSRLCLGFDQYSFLRAPARGSSAAPS